MNVKNVFAPKGLLDKYFNEYEYRSGQLHMANLVDKAIVGKQSAMIEGATGIGKGFAYLVPIILSGKRAIISTSNKSLQDQLSKKDLPLLKKVLKKDFNWTVLKGKSNYFCHEHFKVYKKELEKYLTNNQIKDIADWAETTKDGDVEYYPNDLEPKVKDLITCDTHTIHNKESIYYNLCFAIRARLKAQTAQIILVNHTLVALDIALKIKSKGKISLLPTTDITVIDEAHTFEMFAIKAFSDEVNIFSLYHLLNWREVRNSIPYNKLEAIKKRFSAILTHFLPPKGHVYYQQKKFARFEGLIETIEDVNEVLKKLKNNIKLQQSDLGKKKIVEIIQEGRNFVNRLEKLSYEDEDMLKWSEARTGRDGEPIITLKSVPIDISNILQPMFNDRTVIMTSATLAIRGQFDFFKYQLGVPKMAYKLAVSSPFDFKNNVLIYTSNGEQEKQYEMEQLIKASKGNAFILFTSYKDMRFFYDIVNIPYPKLIQNQGISRAKLLKQYLETPNAVLFATKSFWEGIDIPGKDLVLVIIHKIPFNNPRDLIYTSKIEKIDEKLGKGKHWVRYTIPDACLKLKQGVGRLIRNKTDIGVIALLDARINFKTYGKDIIGIMPPANRTQKLDNVKKFFERKLE